MKYIFIIAILILIIYYYFLFDFSPDNVITYKDSKKFNPTHLSHFCIDRILSKKQTKKFAKKVKNDSDLWKCKNILMNTLGTASYIEGKQGYKFYKKEYIKSNKLLKNHYKELLDIVLNYFKKRCPESNVKYRFALPGFHIFNCNQIFSIPVTSKHIDLQYKQLHFDEHVDLDFDNTLSFTLALELPKSGGGLYVFEKDKKDKIEYSTGYIVCHNGKTFHMIAPSSYSGPNQFRISLQGHGVYDKLSNTWWIYW